MSTAASVSLTSQVEKLLKVALDNNATELRLSGGVAPMLRIDGKLRPLKTNKLISAEDVRATTVALMPPGSDAEKFVFTTALGPYTGSLLDVSGTKVLVLQASAARLPPPLMDAPPQDTSPLELDIPAEDPAERPREVRKGLAHLRCVSRLRRDRANRACLLVQGPW